MATGPKPARTPLEVLAGGELREPPLLTKYGGPGIFGAVTFLSVMLAQWALKRPLMSGIHRTILLTGGAAVAGKYIDDYRNDYLAERDAVFRHYIELHPEDFPEFPRQKYSEVFEPWVPIR